MQSELDALSGRIDYTFTDKFTMFGRYNEAPSSSVNRFANPTTPGTTTANTRTLTIGASQIFSSNFVNDLRFNVGSNNLALTGRTRDVVTSSGYFDADDNYWALDPK